jgi:hypothetical protein
VLESQPSLSPRLLADAAPIASGRTRSTRSFRNSSLFSTIARWPAPFIGTNDFCGAVIVSIYARQLCRRHVVVFALKDENWDCESGSLRKEVHSYKRTSHVIAEEPLLTGIGLHARFFDNKRERIGINVPEMNVWYPAASGNITSNCSPNCSA